MISVTEALDRLFALAQVTGTEDVPLVAASGRVLRAPVIATRDQPPFAASAMDGYACRFNDLSIGAELNVIGAAPAGLAYQGAVAAGQAVRIFTGAPLPDGADTVVIQEDTQRTSHGIQIMQMPRNGANIRPCGADFSAGSRIDAPRRLRPAEIALAAAMNAATLTVSRRPVVALLATGNELVMPGEAPGRDQIMASNCFGLKALFEAEGAEARLLPIARDTIESLTAALALTEGADLIVTIGGASVGDHDLVAAATEALGIERAFYTVAMRPGKPLMAGRLSGTPLIGLPGNPVSAMICGHIFILPVLRAMLGMAAQPLPRQTATIGADLDQNGPREHYMRARRVAGDLVPFDRQDSSLLSVLAEAAALIVRPPGDGPRKAGAVVDSIPL